MASVWFNNSNRYMDNKANQRKGPIIWLIHLKTNLLGMKINLKIIFVLVKKDKNK